MNMHLKKLKESYINITDKYDIDRDNLLADTKVILCICLVIDTLLIFGFSLLMNNLNKNEIENLKKSFEKAQKNNSIMWQYGQQVYITTLIISIFT